MLAHHSTDITERTQRQPSEPPTFRESPHSTAGDKSYATRYLRLLVKVSPLQYGAKPLGSPECRTRRAAMFRSSPAPPTISLQQLPGRIPPRLESSTPQPSSCQLYVLGRESRDSGDILPRFSLEAPILYTSKCGEGPSIVHDSDGQVSQNLCFDSVYLIRSRYLQESLSAILWSI